MGTIFRNELRRYFVTPVGYVFMGAFMLLAGILFFFYNLSYSNGEILSFFSDMTSFLMFLIPVLTMRLFAEERKSRTDQFLLTAPVSLGAVVGGKFLAAVVTYALTLCLTGAYVIIIGVYGTLYWGEVLVGYLGFLLLSCCYISSGLLVSALCENQVSAAVLTFGVHFLFSAVDWVSAALPHEGMRSALEAVSIYTHFKDVKSACLSLSSVVYFVSLTLLFVYFTVLVLRARRGSKA